MRPIRGKLGVSGTVSGSDTVSGTVSGSDTVSGTVSDQLDLGTVSGTADVLH